LEPEVDDGDFDEEPEVDDEELDGELGSEQDGVLDSEWGTIENMGTVI
jgi:hypothetical protein